jgi:hypothetical protein
MNQGEKQEVLLKIYLTYLRDQKIKSQKLGEIKSVKFKEEYSSMDFQSINFNMLENNEEEINKISKKLKIEKSKTFDKADIKINEISYSLKCIGYGKPAIVNHTNREGWLKITKRENLDIRKLDKIIKRYWKLRKQNKIGEDCTNNNLLSPFRNEIKIIKPYLNYFIFKGTGKGDSKNPAEKILEFNKFSDENSWKIYGKEYVDQHWHKLVFSIRSKGMPSNYEKCNNKKLIEQWTEKFKGEKGEEKFRGALHVRSA